MKELLFFLKNIFLKKWPLIIGLLLIVFITNFLTFTAAKSLISTHQGNKDNQFLFQEGLYISNLDPDAQQNFEEITLEQTKNAYQYIDEHFNYAIENYGYIIDLPNQDDMEVNINYINEEAYKLQNISLSKGDSLTFDKDTEVPKNILIGAGLAKDYPLGTTFTINNPMTHRKERLIVSGILQANASHSNYYAPNSKNYFNYSLVYPIDHHFLTNASLDLQVNALNDLILLNTSQREADVAGEFIKSETGLTYNFFDQKDNFHHFQDYYGKSARIIIALTIFVGIIAIILAVWITFVSIRIMKKDFTINLLVGLSYRKLRIILYQYFAILFSITILAVTCAISFERYSSFWAMNSLSTSIGLLRLTNIDWIALIVVVLLDVIIGLIIVEVMMRRLRNIPISLGVLA